ncbi:MAG: hypothetical protein HN509_05780 [Halobacteriovoraceae bacterium]|nr:hypothetical protein [Halobacteriovoraceae bacterium]MBT5094989.1 hypothetical protein [Halobacteriovoraceae bacterium]
MSWRIWGPKICAYPFSRMEISGKDFFLSCCADWMAPSYYKLEKGLKPWNGPQALELRKKILNGDYSYCQTSICQVPRYPLFFLKLLGLFDLFSKVLPNTPLSKNNLKAMSNGESEMPDSPKSLVIQGDFRCNLDCPSCRSQLITTLDASAEKQLERASSDLLKYQDAEIIQLAGDGEPFFSSWHREQIKNFTPQNYPHLKKLILYTNGLLVDSENFQLLSPGSKMINNIIVSIDAGDEATYKRVRRGDWQRLLRNLKWMSELRQKGVLESFRICFVARKENYNSMSAFVDLGHSLKVDQIIFRQLVPWQGMGISNYSEEALHLPENPLHPRYRELCLQLARRSKVVMRAL